jgi:small subunit ribosomal protein S16
MVKIRLRRLGTKARPYYRVVVAESQAGRNGAFVETIGAYDPTRQPKLIELKSDRALHWLLQGAQPTETVAVILNKMGVLEQYFAERPAQKKNYRFLDKRTAPTSVASSVDTPVAVAE